MRACFVIVLIISFFFANVHGTTYRVPDDYPSIQDGIVAAGAGDTVLVAEGVYYESIDFLGQSIVLMSESGPLLTTIDAEESGRVVTFASGEDSTSKLIGFSIINGYEDWEGGAGILCDASSPVIEGSYMAYNIAWGWNVHGGGLLCVDGSAPQIRYCRFLENGALFQQDSGGGAGIACVNGSSPSIQFTHFTDNYTTGGWGGAIYCENNSHPFIYYNYIYGNDIDRYRGAGICCHYNCSPHIEGNEITENSGGCGGGIYCDEFSSPLIEDNYIARNWTGEGSKNGGGGITCKFFSNPIIRDNVLEGNFAVLEGGGILCYWYSCPVIENNLFFDNESEQYGGAINLWWHSDAVITGNTLWQNTAHNGGSAIRCYSSYPEISNNIITYSKRTTAILVDSDSIPIENYNLYWENAEGDAEGLSLGLHDVFCDPLFADPLGGDFDLSADSPAIDAADPLSPVPEGGGPRRDIGYHEFPYAEETVLDFEFYNFPQSAEQRYSLSFSYTMSNLADSTVTTDLWIEASGPLCELIRKMTDVTLEPMESVSDTLKLPIDVTVTAGGYSLKGRLGSYGEVLETGDTFEVEVIAYSGVAIHVPGDFPTIQEAIDEAFDMDTVLVAPGEYPECIDFKGKSLVLRSEEGYAQTTIDAGALGSAVTFMANEDSMAILEGFTITGGSAKYGGGILCHNAAPTVKDNHIVGNTAEGGGGVVLAGFREPRLHDNLIENNVATSFGGGLVVAKDSKAMVRDNVIQSNNAPLGAGVWIGVSANPYLSGNSLLLNIAGDSGGGIAVESASAPEIFNNLLVGNSAVSKGGGIYLCQDGTGDIVNNTILENDAVQGGGVGCFDECTVTLRNNIIAFSPAGHGIYAADQSVLTLASNDLWSNLEADYFGCEPDSTDIAVDPFFVEGNFGLYYLSHVDAGQDTTSHCIDAGDTLAVDAGLDLLTTRTDSVPDSSIVDIGYHYPFIE